MNNSTAFFILCLTIGTLWTINSYACILFGLLVSLSLDVHAIWRNVLVIYFCKVRRRFNPKRLTDLNILKVICLPTDVDLNLHLTHGRLLRECNFGQTEFWVENYVLDNLEKTNGQIKVESYHVTYDHPIRMFETFKITAKILYWDDLAFYMKQTVIRNRDNRECATVLSVHRLSGMTTLQLSNALDTGFASNKPMQPDLVRKLKEINIDISKKF